MADDNIDLAVAVQVADGERVRNELVVAERRASREGAMTLIEKNEGASPLVDRHDVDESVAVEVGRLDHSKRGVRRAKREPFREAGLAVVEVDMALATLAMRDGQIDQPITVEVSRCDRRRRFV